MEQKNTEKCNGLLRILRNAHALRSKDTIGKGSRIMTVKQYFENLKTNKSYTKNRVWVWKESINSVESEDGKLKLHGQTPAWWMEVL